MTRNRRMIRRFFCLVPLKEWKIEIGSFQFKKGVISREEANR